MCGICGFLGDSDKTVLKKMHDVIIHRGPDDHGMYVDTGIGLGHRRLSIIDLSPLGKQPMHNEDESIWIAFNGEIYNFRDLKKELLEKHHKFYSETDTEVIVHAYEEYGLEFAKKLQGMFAIAIWDSKKKQLVLVRDRLGKKPLYYTTINNTFYFSSEIKSFLKISDFNKTINNQAMHDFLTFRYVPEPDTMFLSVKKVPKGSIMTIALEHSKKEKGTSAKIKHIQKFWELRFSEDKNYNENQAIAELNELIKKAVEKRLMSDVPYGVYLSGGLDSSLILGVMNKLEHNAAIKTFSVGYQVSNFKDELSDARKVAEHFGSEHTETIIDYNPVSVIPKVVWHLDEPIADPTAIPIYLLSQETKKKVTVIMSGEGADETFGGYEQYKIMNLLSKASKCCPRIIQKNASGVAINIMPGKVLDLFFKYSSSLGKEGKKRAIDVLSNFKGDYIDYMKIISILNEKEKEELYSDDFKEKSGKLEPSSRIIQPYFENNYSVINKCMNADNNSFLQQLLLKTDKMTMAHAIETRLPFLDTDVAEFAAKLPVRAKVNGFNEKYLLKKVAKRYVPDFVVKRKKQRFFVPVHRWIEDDLEVFSDILTRKDALDRRYFDEYKIKKLLDKYKSSPLYYGRQVWNLVILEHWFKAFVDE